MINYVEIIVAGLLTQGYIDQGGSDVWRLLRHMGSGQYIKVYFSNYTTREQVIIRES